MLLKKYIKKLLRESLKNQRAIDNILDKINVSGYDSLSDTERITLGYFSGEDSGITLQVDTSYLPTKDELQVGIKWIEKNHKGEHLYLKKEVFNGGEENYDLLMSKYYYLSVVVNNKTHNNYMHIREYDIKKMMEETGFTEDKAKEIYKTWVMQNVINVPINYVKIV